ncbi:hypothetical protein Q9L58_006965 [Maublancomyces gigas]|uniref:Ankyrin repeat protein n=1 Tax=Discina gigas TaxID=1032678 RepID=A0ABR3GDP5_9PEZI
MFIKFLLDYGASFKAEENNAFPLATHMGSVKVMKWLLERGADIDAPTAPDDTKHHENSPPDIAITNGNKEALGLLVRRGVGMSEADPEEVGGILGR